MPVADNIVIAPFELLFPAGSAITEQNCISLSISFTLSGGSFNIQVKKNSVAFPQGKDAPVSLPLGYLGLLRITGSQMSRGGLVDIFSGQILPLVASQTVTFTSPPPTRSDPNPSVQMSQAANALGLGSVSWLTRSYPLKNFSFSGQALQGIQSLAGLILADMIIDSNRIRVVPAGQSIYAAYEVNKSDVTQFSQTIDYSRAINALLNPAYNSFPVNFLGDFIYDDEHAQKQGTQLVQAGATGGSGSSDFIPIPDGWLVEGSFEEWLPPVDPANPTDFTNNKATVPRYWKVFPSPSGGGFLRGITSFSRLVKDLKLPGNISTFVGTPVTSDTFSGNGKQFTLQRSTSQSGITGFTASDTLVQDMVTGQAVSVKNALELNPEGGNSGSADQNFFNVQIGLWNFPRVAPTILFQGPVTNPLSVPRNTVLVNPPGNVVGFNSDGTQNGFGAYYVTQYRQVNSARLITSVTFLFRGGTQIPKPGQTLSVAGVGQFTDCGRISTVTLNLSRGGVLVTVQAEKYAFPQIGFPG